MSDQRKRIDRMATVLAFIQTVMNDDTFDDLIVIALQREGGSVAASGTTDNPKACLFAVEVVRRKLLDQISEHGSLSFHKVGSLREQAEQMGKVPTMEGDGEDEPGDPNLAN